MSRFTIEMSYIATITAVVEAENEGEALDKARDVAEEADINEFNIGEEREARVVHVD